MKHDALKQAIAQKSQELGYKHLLDMVLHNCIGCLSPLMQFNFSSTISISFLEAVQLRLDEAFLSFANFSVPEQVGLFRLAESLSRASALPAHYINIFENFSNSFLEFIQFETHSALVNMIYKFRQTEAVALKDTIESGMQLGVISGTLKPHKLSDIALLLNHVLHHEDKSFLNDSLQYIDDIFNEGGHSAGVRFLQLPINLIWVDVVNNLPRIPYCFVSKHPLEQFKDAERIMATKGKINLKFGIMIYTGVDIAEVAARFAHETMHMAAQITYTNNANPYYNSTSDALAYENIWQDVQQRYEKYCVPTAKIDLNIRHVCSSVENIKRYPSEQHHAELIAHFAGLIAAKVPNEAINKIMQSVRQDYEYGITFDMTELFATQTQANCLEQDMNGNLHAYDCGAGFMFSLISKDLSTNDEL